MSQRTEVLSPSLDIKSADASVAPGEVIVDPPALSDQEMADFLAWSAENDVNTTDFNEAVSAYREATADKISVQQPETTELGAEKAHRMRAMLERVGLRADAMQLGFNDPLIGRDEIAHLREQTSEMNATDIKSRVAAEFPYPDEMSLKQKAEIDSRRRKALTLVKMDDESYAMTESRWKEFEAAHLEPTGKWSARREVASQKLSELRDYFRVPVELLDAAKDGDTKEPAKGEREEHAQLKLAEHLHEAGWDIPILQVMRSQYRRKLTALQRAAGPDVDTSHLEQQLVSELVDPFMEANIDDVARTDIGQKLFERRLKKDIISFIQLDPAQRREFTKAARLVELESEVKKDKDTTIEERSSVRGARRIGMFGLRSAGIQKGEYEQLEFNYDEPIKTSRRIKVERTIDSIKKRFSDITWDTATNAVVRLDKATSRTKERYNGAVEKNGRKKTLAIIGAAALGTVIAGTGAYLAFRHGVGPIGGSGNGNALLNDTANLGGDMSVNPNEHLGHLDAIDPMVETVTPPADTSVTAMDVYDTFPSDGNGEIVAPQITEQARIIRVGEGWNSVFKEMNIPASEWDELLQEVGPTLVKQGAAYTMGDSYGINMTPNAIIPDSVLQLILEKR